VYSKQGSDQRIRCHAREILLLHLRCLLSQAYAMIHPPDAQIPNNLHSKQTFSLNLTYGLEPEIFFGTLQKQWISTHDLKRKNSLEYTHSRK
jgi:hypothetical protein